ncbi:FAD-binding oxidoreductase [Nocardioides mangrovicus]|uniref:FAD-binding oxidoreductase n=2 Tax=Nocardioides mangrovicus TaxID=2478913 RepID=A0A3L8P020_9ACTN|nr:FAD-binding oxidoreductase [Nocardioides mangrovicus]
MHWSRWGDPDRSGPLAPAARELVDAFLGTRDTPALAEAEARLAPPLPAHLCATFAGVVGAEQVRVDDATRLRHTRGKSTPDLLLLRSGDAGDAPGAVVRPADHDQVQAVVDVCVREHVALVPFGGGTSVVGGLVADRDGFAGVIALDLARLDRLVEVDPLSGTAVLEAGLRAPEAEALLAEHGLSLGHHPQSFEYATIGGFAATRSSGQASAGYGRFDEMVLGLTAATPRGRLDLDTAPATAAGPDLRQWLLGSEGAFGVITSVRVTVHPLPVAVLDEAWRLPSFAAGLDAVREVARSGLAPAVLRLSDETETALNLADPASVGAQSDGGCLLLTGYEGTADGLAVRREATTALLREAGAEALGPGPGAAWRRGRYDGPYLRDSLLDVGVLVETLETAALWSRLPAVYAAARASLGEHLDPGLVLAHVSHVYDNGASLYFTVAAGQGEDPLGRWRQAKTAVTDAILEAGGTLTHHHAVGRDHKPWLEREVGPVGLAMLRAVKAELDPTGVLNPGVLV